MSGAGQVGADLRDAMLALHEELGDLELAVANDNATGTGDPREQEHDKLAQFFDWDVLHAAVRP